METVTVKVGYGDFTGESAADNGDNSNIQSLANTNGIKGFVVAAELFSGEGDHLFISIFTVDSESYDEFEESAKSNGGIVQVTKHDLDISIDEFLKVFKRFSVVFRLPCPSVKEMQY